MMSPVRAVCRRTYRPVRALEAARVYPSAPTASASGNGAWRAPIVPHGQNALSDPSQLEKVATRHIYHHERPGYSC